MELVVLHDEVVAGWCEVVRIDGRHQTVALVAVSILVRVELGVLILITRVSHNLVGITLHAGYQHTVVSLDDGLAVNLQFILSQLYYTWPSSIPDGLIDCHALGQYAVNAA